MKSSDHKFSVTVGAKASARNPSAYQADVYGPFDNETAYGLAERVRVEFAKHSSESFIYGEPFVEVHPILCNTLPTPADAVKNWVNDPADNA